MWDEFKIVLKNSNAVGTLLYKIFKSLLIIMLKYTSPLLQLNLCTGKI